MNISAGSDCMVELLDYVRKYSNSDEVAVTIHITSSSVEVKTHSRRPEDLKREGISMRNLQGEWVK